MRTRTQTDKLSALRDVSQSKTGTGSQVHSFKEETAAMITFVKCLFKEEGKWSSG